MISLAEAFAGLNKFLKSLRAKTKQELKNLDNKTERFSSIMRNICGAYKQIYREINKKENWL